MNDQEPTALEERLARHLAANDWIIDKGATSPWENRSAEFRNDYVAYAREVLAIVREEDGKAEADVVAALRDKAQELSAQAEEEMRRDLEELPDWARDQTTSAGRLLLWLGEQIESESSAVPGHATAALRAALTECSYWHGRSVAATTERFSMPDLAARYEVAMMTVRAMAAAYADHPGYDEAWRP